MILRALVAVVLALALAGCGGNGEAAPEVGGQEVELEVVEGPDGATLAFLDVTIAGQGPYAFALDTGASHSLVDEAIANELGLMEVGETTVTGVVGVAEAVQVEVESWSIDGVELPATRLVTIPFDAGGPHFELRGLLGSDVLSEFNVFLLDYERGRLVLNPELAEGGG